MSPAKGPRKGAAKTTAKQAPGAATLPPAIEGERETPRERAVWIAVTLVATVAIYASTLDGGWLWDDE